MKKLVWMIGVGLALLAGTLEAASCNGNCRCGGNVEWACFQDCDEGWSALCTDGSCGAFIASCCCQQVVLGGGLNYFCVEKTCGIQSFRSSFSSEAPLPGTEEILKLRPGTSAGQAEEWAYLEYQIGAERKVVAAKVRYTSNPLFGETLVQQRLHGQRSALAGPGTYRSFELRPPQGRPGFGDERRLAEASRLLKVPVPESAPDQGVFAWRIELNPAGDVLDRTEIFSTSEGLSSGLDAPLEAFLDHSGLREAGKPLVVFLVYQIEQKRIVSVGVSNYLGD
ncbi:MAG TPA: hypothetical protein VEL74_19915 [Thermoanaerobaculia bacterium]|nr:hypothetical protein [Thermoanaerobaculia bacterium]